MADKNIHELARKVAAVIDRERLTRSELLLLDELAALPTGDREEENPEKPLWYWYLKFNAPSFVKISLNLNALFHYTDFWNALAREVGFDLRQVSRVSCLSIPLSLPSAEKALLKCFDREEYGMRIVSAALMGLLRLKSLRNKIEDLFADRNRPSLDFMNDNLIDSSFFSLQALDSDKFIEIALSYGNCDHEFIFACGLSYLDGHPERFGDEYWRLALKWMEKVSYAWKYCPDLLDWAHKEGHDLESLFQGFIRRDGLGEGREELWNRIISLENPRLLLSGFRSYNLQDSAFWENLLWSGSGWALPVLEEISGDAAYAESPYRLLALASLRPLSPEEFDICMKTGKRTLEIVVILSSLKDPSMEEVIRPYMDSDYEEKKWLVRLVLALNHDGPEDMLDYYAERLCADNPALIPVLYRAFGCKEKSLPPVLKEYELLYVRHDVNKVVEFYKRYPFRLMRKLDGMIGKSRDEREIIEILYASVIQDNEKIRSFMENRLWAVSNGDWHGLLYLSALALGGRGSAAVVTAEKLWRSEPGVPSPVSDGDLLPLSLWALSGDREFERAVFGCLGSFREKIEPVLVWRLLRGEEEVPLEWLDACASLKSPCSGLLRDIGKLLSCPPDSIASLDAVDELLFVKSEKIKVCLVDWLAVNDWPSERVIPCLSALAADSGNYVRLAVLRAVLRRKLEVPWFDDVLDWYLDKEVSWSLHESELIDIVSDGADLKYLDRLISLSETLDHKRFVKAIESILERHSGLCLVFLSVRNSVYINDRFNLNDKGVTGIEDRTSCMALLKKAIEMALDGKWVEENLGKKLLINMIRSASSVQSSGRLMSPGDFFRLAAHLKIMYVDDTSNSLVAEVVGYPAGEILNAVFQGKSMALFQVIKS